MQAQSSSNELAALQCWFFVVVSFYVGVEADQADLT